MTGHNGTAILAALIALSCGTTQHGGFSCAGQDLAECGAREPRDEAVDPIRVLSAEQARRLEGNIQHHYATHAPAVVRIWPKQKPSEATEDRNDAGHGSFTGVIIDPSGLILTCAHHGEAPGTKTVIQLSDGKRVAGEFLGRFVNDSPKPMQTGVDLGLAKITSDGPWPAVAVHDSETQVEAQMCLAIGYPVTLPPGQPPLLRAGRILPRFRDSPWLETTTNLEGGDSGGPLFDLSGRVVGVASSADNVGPAKYELLSALKEHRQRLEAGEIVAAARGYVRASRSRPAQAGAFVPAPDLDDQVLKIGRNIIRIMDGPHDVAAGLIVDANGLALTKASLVGSRREWACRLFYVTGNTAIVKGSVVATSPIHDLALLKVDVHNWPVAPWSPHRPGLGTIVCSPLGRSGEPMRFAVVGTEVAAELAKRNDIPQIPISIEQGAENAPVVSRGGWMTAEFDGYRDLLKPGDIVVRVNDIETPTVKEFGSAIDRLTYARSRDGESDYQVAAPESFAGDWVHFHIRRGNEHLTIPIPKVHTVGQGALTWHANPLSLRREAFPSVFAHDGRLRPDQCGGPVVDLRGNIVGLNIARVDATRTLAIPTDVLQMLLSELRRQAVE